MRRRIHLRYKGTGYTDVGVCQPWDWRSKQVTKKAEEVTCKQCLPFCQSEKKRGKR